MSRILIRICNLFQNLVKRFRKHFNDVLLGADPIMSIEDYDRLCEIKKAGLKYSCLASAIIAWLITFDYLVCNIITSFNPSTTWFNLKETFLLVTTRTWPALTVKQRNIVTSQSYIFGIVFYTILTFDRFKHMRFITILYKRFDGKYFMIQNGIILSENLKNEYMKFIMKISSWKMSLIRLVMFQIYILFPVPYAFGEIFIPDRNSWSFRRIIYFPIIFYYSIFVGYFAIFSLYFLLVCKYVQIKQRFLRKQLENDRKWFRNGKYMSLKMKNLGLSCWMRNMKKCINIVTEISFYNAYWSAYISAYFIIYLLQISVFFFLFISVYYLFIIVNVLNVPYIFHIINIKGKN